MDKITIDCRMIGSSGIGTFIRGILSYLTKIDDFQLLLIGESDKLKQYSSINVKIIDCQIKPFSIKELLSFPTAEINKTKLFFSPNYNIPSGIKVPILSIIHDVLFLDFPNLKSKIGIFFRRKAVERAVNLSTHIFTVSEFSKSRILFHYPNVRSINVCYNGYEEVKKKYVDFSSSQINDEYYLFIGNIKPHKGLDVLLDAYQSIKSKTNKKLVIVGESNNFKTSDASIFNKIKLLNNDKKIIFTGYVNQIQLISLIRNAYCLIQPSIYEGFGLPPLEAMVLHTPVILSDIPVFNELYSDFPVIYFKSGNADSLANAMLKSYSKIDLTEAQLNKYTYKKTCDIIVSTIKNKIYESTSTR